jgi:hypothetical protein
MATDTLRTWRVAVATVAVGMVMCSALPNPATRGLMYLSAEQGPHYSDWSQPQVVSVLNTSLAEYPNGISRDGLSLYFQRANPVTGEDLYVAHRSDHEADWGVPVQLPDTINTRYNERAAFVSADGHWLYFASDRPGGMGGFDLYISWRTNVHEDNAWEPAQSLSAVNSVGFDSGPTLFEDEESGTTQLFFNSAPFPRGTQAVADIYVSALGPDGFQTPVPVVELNSAVQEGRPYIRHDGREIFFQSNRAGKLEIWSSTRSSTAGLWTEPTVAIGIAELNDPTVAAVTTPVVSWDRATLFLGVVRPGIDMGNIFVATREKVTGKR